MTGNFARAKINWIATNASELSVHHGELLEIISFIKFPIVNRKEKSKVKRDFQLYEWSFCMNMEKKTGFIKYEVLQILKGIDADRTKLEHLLDNQVELFLKNPCELKVLAEFQTVFLRLPESRKIVSNYLSQRIRDNSENNRIRNAYFCLFLSLARVEGLDLDITEHFGLINELFYDMSNQPDLLKIWTLILQVFCNTLEDGVKKNRILHLIKEEGGNDRRDSNNEDRREAKFDRLRQRSLRRQLSNESLSLLNGRFNAQLLIRLSSRAVRVFHHATPYSQKYKLEQLVHIKEMGEGTQANVFVVRTPTNPTQLVLKLFKEGQNVSAEEVLKEYTKLSECGNHPNIVQMYGMVYNEDGSVPIGILMEYMNCGSLFKVIHNLEELYGEKEVLEWSLQATNALIHLHSKGLIHRDVKPGNLLVSQVGDGKQVKLADFGMVRRETAAGGRRYSSFGTYSYLAPEGIPVGSANSFSSAVDIYSLGIIIWEIAQRKKPFLEENLVAFDLENIIKRPSLTYPSYPWLPDLVERMWSQDPRTRPTITTVCEKLNELYNSLFTGIL